MGILPQQVSNLANPEGVQLGTLAENTRLITNHQDSTVHQAIINRLMAESVLDEQDLTNILQHKETPQFLITNRLSLYIFKHTLCASWLFIVG